MALARKFLLQKYLGDHLSAKEISQNGKVSENQVWYWLTKYNIPIRTRSDANYCKYNPHGDPYHIDVKLTLQETKLLFLALGLFWGEGNKRSVSGVRIGNSDPQLLIIWCDFLRKVCHVDELKIRFDLQIFKDMDLGKAIEFWSNSLGILSSRINTAKPLASMGKGTYKRISRYGVMTVGVYNIHFRKWIMEQLYKLGYNPEM